MNQYKNISMSDNKDTSIDLKSNEACFLQRLVELNLKDQRNTSLIVYPLYTIVTVIILARMAGCNNSRSQRLFWQKNKKQLQSLIYGLGDEVPSEQTIRRVIALVKADETVKFLSEYFVSHRENILKPLGSVPLAQREVVAADGQNIRATRSSKDGNDSRKNGGYDVVSLFSSTYGVTLCQRTVDKKNNEALAIMEMIKDLNLANSILTWDAINTRAATLKAVTEADADFLVCLKSNQGYLYEEVCDSFTFADADRYLGEVLSSKRVSSDHGRIEEKEITILDAEHGLSKEMQRKWPYIKSLIRVNTTRTYKCSGVSNTDDVESRYFVSSIITDGLDKSFADTIQDIILARWQIESRHWVIDVAFDQDRLPLRNQDYIRNSTVYTKMACNVLSYIRDNVPLYQSKPWSFDSLQMLASDVEYGFMFLKAFFTQDMSEIENDERFIGLFYKEPEPTGNDVPDNLEVNGFENTISDDTPLGRFARTRKKIKRKR